VEELAKGKDVFSETLRTLLAVLRNLGEQVRRLDRQAQTYRRQERPPPRVGRTRLRGESYWIWSRRSVYKRASLTRKGEGERVRAFCVAVPGGS
jgi:hypothetical protein